MLFSHVVALFSASLIFGTLAFASPESSAVRFAKRDNAAIEEVFTTLKSSTDSILPQIQTIASSGNATSDIVTPLITQLVDSLDTATTSLSGLSSSSLALKTRQSDSDIATLVAGIISDIATALNTTVAITGIETLLPGIDTSLSEVLTGLETLLSGVLHLVANLLTDVASLLNNLALGLTLGALGL